jgi:hypothetical protein
MQASAPRLDLTRAPFRLAPAHDAVLAAAEIESCFRDVEALPAKVSACFRAVTEAAGLDRGEPLVAAGMRVAADIDAGVGAGIGNPYHNTQHFCEVLLGALCLSNLETLDAHERALLLFAALVHDFHHDGRYVKGAHFRLERKAAEAAAPYMAQAGVAPDDRERIAALVLATDLVTGVPFARGCHRHHVDGSPCPGVPPEAGELAALASDARLALLAVMLTEADVLPSVGLTVALGDERQALVSREIGLRMGPADKLSFLDNVFGDFEVGRFFTPNLQAMKREMAERVRQQAGSAAS